MFLRPHGNRQGYVPPVENEDAATEESNTRISSAGNKRYVVAILSLSLRSETALSKIG